MLIAAWPRQVNPDHLPNGRRHTSRPHDAITLSNFDMFAGSHRVSFRDYATVPQKPASPVLWIESARSAPSSQEARNQTKSRPSRHHQSHQDRREADGAAGGTGMHPKLLARDVLGGTLGATLAAADVFRLGRYFHFGVVYHDATPWRRARGRAGLPPSWPLDRWTISWLRPMLVTSP